MSSQKLRHLPNCITFLRIVATVCMLFIEPFTPAFFTVYTLAGFSDVLDGWLARKLGIVSEFGAQLDSAADLMFYALMILRIFPVLWASLPRVIWIGVQSVVGVRLISYTVAGIKYRRFASLHTYINKVTGAMVFAIPYVIKTAAGTPFCWSLCAVSSIGTLEELTIHLCAKEYNSCRKSIFHLKKHM